MLLVESFYKKQPLNLALRSGFDSGCKIILMFATQFLRKIYAQRANMAHIAKTANGKRWRASIRLKTWSESATFDTKAEARAWADNREKELRDGVASPTSFFTLKALLERYRDEVSPSKRGHRWEIVRIDKILKQALLPLDKLAAEIQPLDIANFRDASLRRLQPGSVLRELGMLSAIFEHARLEWRLVPSNPVADIRKPPSPPHRELVISRNEIKLLLREMGYSPSMRITSVTQALAVLFLLALRTGMRSGELCGLSWDRVFDSKVRLVATKTKPRDVPITSKSKRLIEKMSGYDPKNVFGELSPNTRDALFRRLRDRAGIHDITFHDARHTAATWLARKLDVLDLCKMFGWASTSRALTYYNPSAEDIARRIDKKR